LQNDNKRGAEKIPEKHGWSEMQNGASRGAVYRIA
jgi:hypothetical protein